MLGADGPVQVTKLVDTVQSVAWSSTGAWLAYDVAPGGGLNVQVHVVRPDGSGDRLVTSGGTSNNRLFGWTKNGAVLRIGSAAADPSRFEPQLIDLASGTVRKVGEGSPGLRSFLVSNDGRRITIDRAVTRGDGNIWLTDGTGGAERLVTSHKGRAQFSTIGLSPDARRLWLIGNGDTDNYALASVDIAADGTPGPLLTTLSRSDAELETAELSDDGRTIALVWNTGGRNELSWFDTATSKERKGPVLPVDIISAPNFSPDGAALVMTGTGAAAPANLYRVTVAGNGITRLTNSAHDGVDLTGFARPRQLKWQTRDGTPLSGWLYSSKGVGAAADSLHLSRRARGPVAAKH